MKLYLAHPLALRHEIRKAELVFEEATGIELLNPFYDTNRKDIEALDRGEVTVVEYGTALNPDTIVEGDLGLIDQSEGTVAFLDRNVPMMGTHCEMWYTLTAYKPAYVVSANMLFHPWVRYIVRHSAGKAFADWCEIEAYFNDR